MRVMTQDLVGPAHVLRVAEVERPVPGPSEVLFRVIAAGVNPVDAAIRAGGCGSTGHHRSSWVPSSPA